MKELEELAGFQKKTNFEAPKFLVKQAFDVPNFESL